MATKFSLSNLIYYFTFLLLMTCVAAIGVYIHFTTHIVSQVPIKNYYLNIWFVGCLGFFIFQSLLLQNQPKDQKRSKAYIIGNNAYFIVMAIIFLEMAASWDVYGREDIGILSLLCIVVCIFNIYQVSSKSSRQKDYKKPRKTRVAKGTSNETSHLISSSDTSDEDGATEFPNESEKTRRGTKSGSFFQEAKTWVNSCCENVNIILKATVLIAVCLLFHGAILHGTGTQSFPPTDGTFLALGEGQTIYYWCSNSTSETYVVLMGNEDQGVGDFLGIFEALKQYPENVRACIWDPPGIGYSDFSYPDQDSYRRMQIESFLSTFHLNSSASSFVLVGYESGGERILEFAKTKPQLVSSVILIDTVRDKFDERAVREVTNATDSVIAGLENLSYLNEYRLFQFYNAFGVPLGLTRALVPHKNTSAWSREAAKEQRWFDVTEKSWDIRMWNAQSQLLLQSPKFATLISPNTSTPSTSNSSGAVDKIGEIAIKMPVHVLMSAWNDGQVDKLVCQRQRLSRQECEIRKRLARFAAKEKRSLSQNGGQIVECVKEECSPKFHLFDHPKRTAEIILSLIVNKN